MDERRRTQSVRRSEAIERNEAYEAFSAACQFVEVKHGQAQTHCVHFETAESAQ
jgi:hypothetical protein